MVAWSAAKLSSRERLTFIMLISDEVKASRAMQDLLRPASVAGQPNFAARDKTSKIGPQRNRSFAEISAKFPTQRNRELFCWNRDDVLSGLHAALPGADRGWRSAHLS